MVDEYLFVSHNWSIRRHWEGICVRSELINLVSCITSHTQGCGQTLGGGQLKWCDDIEKLNVAIVLRHAKV